MYYNYTGDQNWIWKCTKAGVSCRWCLTRSENENNSYWHLLSAELQLRFADRYRLQELNGCSLHRYTYFLWMLRLASWSLLCSFPICSFPQYPFKRSCPTLEPNAVLPAVIDSFFFLPNWSHFIRSNFDKDSNCHPILRQWQDQYEFSDDKYYYWVSTKKQRKWKIHLLRIKTVRGTRLPWSTCVWILLTTIDAVHVDGWGRTDGLCQSNSEGKRAPSALVHRHFGNVGVN